VLRQHLAHCGFELKDYQPAWPVFADFEARLRLRSLHKPDCVWVPCFRQRDAAAARHWSRAKGLPLIFDPLISAYDKQVFEQQKFASSSRSAERLRSWESRLFCDADLVIADTHAHAQFFADALKVPQEKLAVIMVGAEETLFAPLEVQRSPQSIPEILFYGSFIDLQGPEVIVEAARLYSGPPVQWTMLGSGPLLERCLIKAQGVRNVRFEPWLEYEKLPSRIHQAEILLGVFGSSAKAERVIPNKVFQSLAAGRPVITRESSAYPEPLRKSENSGIFFVPAGNPDALARQVRELACQREALTALGTCAARSYLEHFSSRVVRAQVLHALTKVGL
jgi:glycosyltransferase involved in cell wall biosynthesis